MTSAEIPSLRRYPGSTTPIPQQPAATKPHYTKLDDDDLGPPLIRMLDGRNVEFYTIGTLARLLKRDAGTLRKWEKAKYLPRARYGTKSMDFRGKRRLYTRDHIEGIYQIAVEEGLLVHLRIPLDKTNFTARCRELFRALEKQQQGDDA